MADLKLITEYAKTLSKCGRPVPPSGLSYVDIPHGLLYQVTTPASSAATGNRFVEGDTVFIVRAIPAVQDVDTFVRVQWPGGRFLSNALMPLALNAFVSSFRRPLTRDSVVCEPGSNIRITTDTTVSASESNVSILFDGVYRYALKGGEAVPITSIADMPRYRQNPNGNILAPEMDLDMVLSEVPTGYRQIEYRLVSNSFTMAPGSTLTIGIPISNAYDYLLRKIIFQPVPVGLLIRPRDGSGYELCTDYAPATQLSNALYAANWCLSRGTTLFIDCVNPSTAAPATFTVTTTGVQQKRAA